MQDMTISQAKNARAQLEMDLQKLISARVSKFKEETGLMVASIDVNATHQMELGAGIITMITVKVYLDLI